MPYEPFPIADMELGLYENRKPWLSPSRAWRDIRNARIHRGRIFKRQGFKHYATLGTKITQESLGSISGTPTELGNWPAAPSVSSASAITNTPVLPPRPSPSLYNLSLFADPYYFRIAAQVSGTVWSLESWDGGVAAALADIDSARIDLASGEWFVTLSSGNFADSGDIEVTYEYRRGLPVVGIHRFVDATGVPRAVAADTRRLWAFDSGQQRFEEVDPDSAGVTDVSGTDVWSGAASDLVQATPYLDILVLNNNKDRPQLYDPVGGLREQDTDLDTPGGTDKDINACLATLNFKGSLILIRPTENGTDRTRRVRWTPVEEIERFVFGDSFDVPSETPIRHGRLIGDKAVVFCERKGEAFELFSTGDPLVPFEPRRLRGEGDSLSRLGGVNVIDEAILWGRSTLLRCDGSECIRFKQDEIPDFVLSQNLDAFESVFGLDLDEIKEVWFLFAPQGQSTPTQILVMNTETGACYLHEFPLICGGLVSASDEPTWDTDEEPWDSDETTWDEGGAAASFPRVLVGDSSGRIYTPISGQYTDDLLDASEQASASLYTMQLQSQRLNPIVDGRQPVWTEVRMGNLDIIAEPNPDAMLTVSITADYGGNPYLIRELDLAPDRAGDDTVFRRIPVFRSAKFHEIRIEETSGSRVVIDAVVPWFSVTKPFRRKT